MGKTGLGVLDWTVPIGLQVKLETVLLGRWNSEESS